MKIPDEIEIVDALNALFPAVPQAFTGALMEEIHLTRLPDLGYQCRLEVLAHSGSRAEDPAIWWKPGRFLLVVTAMSIMACELKFGPEAYTR